MSDLLRDLYAHMWWAHDALAEELTRASPDAESLRLLAHIVAAAHLWLSRIDGQKPRVAVWPELALADVMTLERENRTRFKELLERRDDARAQRIRYRNSGGNTFENSVGEILTHVAMHGHYHRGQIAKTMRASGREPVYTDYIGFIRKGR